MSRREAAKLFCPQSRAKGEDVKVFFTLHSFTMLYSRPVRG